MLVDTNEEEKEVEEESLTCGYAVALELESNCPEAFCILIAGRNVIWPDTELSLKLWVALQFIQQSIALQIIICICFKPISVTLATT